MPVLRNSMKILNVTTTKKMSINNSDKYLTNSTWQTDSLYPTYPLVYLYSEIDKLKKKINKLTDKVNKLKSNNYI